VALNAPPLVAPPLALYVHFPWCVRKCPYCDFNSHALKGELPEAAYVDALLADLDAQLAALGARGFVPGPLASVFLGGGTPSLFGPDAFARLLQGVRGRLALPEGAEITLEANPGTVERHRFSDYRAAGINRVSLGAQSFADAQLERLGRIHAADDTRRAAAELHAAGLANFNLDLMVALPGQDEAGAVADVEAALSLDPAHVSHYQLTLEPGTVFGSLPPAGLPDEDAAERMTQAAHERLVEAGFVQYEVSAWSRAAARSVHNLNYWRFGDYLGIGAGAHGKASVAGQVLRSAREREPRRYLAAAAQSPSHDAVAGAQLPFEFMLNALRLVEGFEPSLYESRTGLSWAALEPVRSALRARGLLVEDPAGCRPSALGRRFMNDVVGAFLPD
jgi:oxygen-independent coproporphyrinogen-3 oxidase